MDQNGPSNAELSPAPTGPYHKQQLLIAKKNKNSMENSIETLSLKKRVVDSGYFPIPIEKEEKITSPKKPGAVKLV